MVKFRSSRMRHSPFDRKLLSFKNSPTWLPFTSYRENELLIVQSPQQKTLLLIVTLSLKQYAKQIGKIATHNYSEGKTAKLKTQTISFPLQSAQISAHCRQYLITQQRKVAVFVTSYYFDTSLSTSYMIAFSRVVHEN